MSWILFAVIYVFAASVANLYQKIAMREEKSDAVASSIVFQIFFGICLSVFALIKGFHIPPASLAPYFLGSSIFYAIGTVFLFRAIKRIEASELSIISGFGAIVTIIASFIFLRESLTLSQFLGAGSILTAVVLLNLKRNGFILNTGMWPALIGTFFFGSAVIFDTIIVRSFDAVSFIPLTSIGSALILLMWYSAKIPTVVHLIKKVNYSLVVYSVLYAISAISFYLALETGILVGQISSIGRSSIILTVILSTIFLGERTNLIKKLFGAVLTTIGVILVSQ